MPEMSAPAENNRSEPVNTTHAMSGSSWATESWSQSSTISPVLSEFALFGRFRVSTRTPACGVSIRTSGWLSDAEGSISGDLGVYRIGGQAGLLEPVLQAFVRGQGLQWRSYGRGFHAAQQHQCLLPAGLPVYVGGFVECLYRRVDLVACFLCASQITLLEGIEQGHLQMGDDTARARDDAVHTHGQRPHQPGRMRGHYLDGAGQ